MLEGEFRLAHPKPERSAEIPSGWIIRVQRKSSVYRGDALVEGANAVSEREPCGAERYGILLSEIHRSASQLRGFGLFHDRIRRPAIGLGTGIAPSGHAIGGGIVRIELHGPVEQA